MYVCMYVIHMCIYIYIWTHTYIQYTTYAMTVNIVMMTDMFHTPYTDCFPTTHTAHIIHTQHEVTAASADYYYCYCYYHC